jgi:hypothetical protein
MSDLFRIAFMEMRCLQETTEGSDSDEPYIVFCAIDLNSLIPGVTVLRTRVFDDTDQGSLDKQWLRIWGVNGKAMPIANPDKVIILVGLMENDNADPELVVTMCRAAMFGNVASLVSSGVPHATMVNTMVKAFASTLDFAAGLVLVNGDDRLGPVQQLKITNDILAAAKKGTQRINLVFDGSQKGNGKYRLGFDVAAGSGK